MERRDMDEKISMLMERYILSELKNGKKPDQIKKELYKRHGIYKKEDIDLCLFSAWGNHISNVEVPQTKRHNNPLKLEEIASTYKDYGVKIVDTRTNKTYEYDRYNSELMARVYSDGNVIKIETYNRYGKREGTIIIPMEYASIEVDEGDE